MKEEILCLTEIMDRKSICADVSYKWRITVYKHLGGSARHEFIIHKSFIRNVLNLSDTNHFGP